jgi:hypothetical protein
LFFIGDFIAIAIGSFLFHTMPSASTAAADTGPIGAFMLAYLVFAMRRFAGASWFFTAAAVAAFIGLAVMAFNVQCWDGRIGFLLEDVPEGARARCLNGSLGYAPALLAMLAMGCWLEVRCHRAARLILAAAAIFIVSLTFRSLDHTMCSEWVMMGHRMGTHFLWHLLNALTLFLLLAAAIRYGSPEQELLPPRPKARRPVYAQT